MKIVPNRVFIILVVFLMQGTAVFAGTAPGGSDVGDGVIVGLSDSCMDQAIQNEVVKMGQIQILF